MNEETESKPIILVVDDSKAARGLLQRKFRDAGYEVLTACDYDEAMTVIHNHASEYMVAIVDIHMPGQYNGLDLIRRIDETVSDRVISYAWTADVTEKLEDEALDSGAYDVFSKLTDDHNRIIRHVSKSPIQKLVRKLSVDQLTGLDNSMRFNSIAVGLLKKSAARKRPKVISLVHIDVDHFKMINEKHGHILADEGLKDVARILKEHTRSSDQSDHLCRRSGAADEFLILLPEMTEEGTMEIGKKLQMEVCASKGIKTKDGCCLLLSISFGVAQITHDEIVSIGIEMSWKLIQEQAEQNMKVARTLKRKLVA